MNFIKLVPGVSLQTEGAKNACFRQGDLDGACGIYAVMTAIVAQGDVTREAASSIWNSIPDGRTAFAKSLQGFGPLVQDGISDLSLMKLIRGIDKYLSPPNQWSPGMLPGNRGRETIQEIIAYIDNKNCPVIARLDWEGAEAHWSVVVGYTASFPNGAPEHLLFIDPGFESSRVHLWNATLNLVEKKKGPKPYHYQTQGHESHDSYCQVSQAIVIY